MGNTSSSSAGASSSAQHISQNAYRSAENSLGYPGRGEVDVRAPYMFKCEISSSGNALKNKNQLMQLKKSERLRKRYYVVAFYQIAEGRVDRMPPYNTYQRQAWTVGIAFNRFNFTRRAPRRLREKLAHWGIYIRPQVYDSTYEPALNRVFGMNWEEKIGSLLILEDVWGTPGQDMSGDWKKLVKATEFEKVTNPKYQETTMYFSLEEFVLEPVTNTKSLLVVQWLLRQFIARTLGRNGPQYTWDDLNIIHPGAAYSLTSANCQDFVKFAMDVLKDHPSYNFTDFKRLCQPFALSSLESKVLRVLEREQAYVEQIKGDMSHIVVGFDQSGIHDVGRFGQVA
ncbi:PPPDE peptidase domain-containing protein [Penicillium concentricum]|uniref:PPPDE peptidase domain-containing protein n=1 Tax=Penicillium concentricum TaxID=293559 RepID=A0A9W9USK4_9EURO|nr:PPPDE peptidase domain-containing protein [Penicillium concentricum]KAJ5355943.1 PPPDE peptidase domain-containing protein [Penicillium concentricum]